MEGVGGGLLVDWHTGAVAARTLTMPGRAATFEICFMAGKKPP